MDTEITLDMVVDALLAAEGDRDRISLLVDRYVQYCDEEGPIDGEKRLRGLLDGTGEG